MHVLCDLGTSNFRVVQKGSDGIFSEPSVIAQVTGHGVTIGNEAYEMIGRNPYNIRIVTPIEGGVIQNVDAAAEIIKYSVQRLAGSWSTRRFSITLSVPAQLTPVERRAFEDAAKLAGAKHVQFLNASVAGAVGAGLPVEGPNGCFVVNLGGGMTEVSLLSLNGIVASHGFRRGGQAINEGIIERIRRDYQFQIGMRSAEVLKCTLSLDRQLECCEVRGRDVQTGLPKSVCVPRSVVDDPVNTYCDSIVDLIGQVLGECPPELAGDIIETGIVLVGGGANMKGLVENLQEKLEAPIVVSDQPENAVIWGLMNAEQTTGDRGRAQWITKAPWFRQDGAKSETNERSAPPTQPQ